MIDNRSNIPIETFQPHSERIKNIEQPVEQKAEVKNIKNEIEIKREKLLKELKKKQDEKAKINNRIKEYRIDLKLIEKDIDLINLKIENLKLKEKIKG